LPRVYPDWRGLKQFLDVQRSSVELVSAEDITGSYDFSRIARRRSVSGCVSQRSCGDSDDFFPRYHHIAVAVSRLNVHDRTSPPG
jgi:hypothetical protein